VVRAITCGCYHTDGGFRAIKCVFYHKDWGLVDLKSKESQGPGGFKDGFGALGGRWVV
jgi:hypothetical protein